MSDQTTDAALQFAENFLRGQIAVLEADRVRADAERAKLDAERAKIDAEIAKTKGALAEMIARIGSASSAPGPSSLPAPRDEDVFKAEMPKRGAFAGLELTDAIYEYLVMNRQMISIKEIWAALEKAGVKVVSGHPTRAISEALRKRAKRRTDVFKAGNRWGAAANFSHAYIKRITKKHAGMGGRSAEEHANATSEGIERRRARGLRVGAPRKFDAAAVVRFRQLRAEGATIGAACKAVDISRPLFQLYRNRIKIWKEGTPWPPPEPTREELALAELEEAQSQPARLRVVK